MTVIRVPRRRWVSRANTLSGGRPGAGSLGEPQSTLDAERPPANLHFLLTPDNDPTLDYLDTLTDLELLDDTEREARIAVARLTGS